MTKILQNVALDDNDLLASLDVVSLYPSIPVDEALDKIAQNENFSPHIIDLSRHCMKNTYFMFNGQFYRQVEGAPMGSSLSPVIANLFMIYFETDFLKNCPLKPKLWKRYVDDIFIIWPHGKNELDNLLKAINTVHQQIQFTLEIENKGSLPFLDLLATRENNKISYTVYRKPTHTNRYLNAESHHHPAQIQAVANTLVSRSFRLTQPENREKEIAEITSTLRQNAFKGHNIRKALNTQSKTSNRAPEEPKEARSTTSLPYIKGVTDKVGRILRKHQVRPIYRPLRTIATILGNPKDKVPLENHGVYKIPCSNCDKTYVGQTNRRIAVRIEEHKNSIKTKQTTSALFQHHLETGHNIDFENSRQIAAIENYKTRITRESLEIEIQGQLNKRDDALNFPNTWKTILPRKTTSDFRPKTQETTMPPNIEENTQENKRTPSTKEPFQVENESPKPPQAKEPFQVNDKTPNPPQAREPFQVELTPRYNLRSRNNINTGPKQMRVNRS